MCVFCNQNRISGNEKPASAEDVKKTVDEALKILPRDTEKTIAFYGGSFTAIPADEQESFSLPRRDTLRTEELRASVSVRDRTP